MIRPDDVKAPLMRGLAFNLTSRLLPFYRLQALALEPCVTLREMMIAEPSAPVGRQWRGMDTLKDEMFLGVDEGLLVAGIASPEQEDDMRTAVRDGLYDSVGECLPPFALVRAWLMLPDGQRGIEQKDTLTRPAAQRAIVHLAAIGIGDDVWHAPRIGLYLLENVDERGRQRYPCLHAEA